MITLYDFALSGNCHKVRLLLSCLRLPWKNRTVDVLAHETKADWFVSLNSLCQVPVLRDGAFVLRDSQAILAYLAQAYGPEWGARNAAETGNIQQWLSFAANEIGNTLQPARLFHRIGEHTDIAAATRRSMTVLTVLDASLAEREWLACDRPTIADIACFPYVALAREGRLPLDEFPHVLRWIDRVTRLDGYVAMEGLPQVPAACDAPSLAERKV